MQRLKDKLIEDAKLKIYEQMQMKNELNHIKEVKNYKKFRKFI